MNVSAEERTAIIAALRAGGSVCGVARESGRNKSTISRIAAAEGIDTQRCATEKATAARLDFDQAGRLALINELVSAARTMLPGIRKPIELQQLSTAVAIMIDKRRLEDGEATNRTETYDAAAVDEEINARITAITSRRRSEMGA